MPMVLYKLTYHLYGNTEIATSTIDIKIIGRLSGKHIRNPCILWQQIRTPTINTTKSNIYY